MSSDWLSPEEERRALAVLEGTFGIPPAAFAGHRLLRRGEHVFAVHREAAGACDAYRWVGAGLRLLKTTGGGSYKPATRGLQLFGRLATRRVCDLERPALRALLSGQSLPWEGEDGPLLLRWQGSPLGLGLARAGHLVSQLPRSVTEHLRVGE
ncbi:MAG: hypothetical protein SCH98_17745 [Deferrisomatales bacterium]|nr:hypothetical protein [Deferrisomatales bacterium]